MGKPRDDRHRDLFRPALDQIIDLQHPLVRLAGQIDWGFLDQRFGSVCSEGPGHPPLPTRLVAGLFILKHTHNLSDEVLCARWIENPYYQYFCGEQVFRHELPFDRSSLTRWRQRLGEEQLVALIQESLSVAHKTGQDGRDRDQGPRAGGRGHDRAAEGDCASDRRAVDAPGADQADRPGPTQRGAATPELCARG
jgi:IS5 family transposase